MSAVRAGSTVPMPPQPDRLRAPDGRSAASWTRSSTLAFASLSSNLDSTREAFSCPNLDEFKHTLYQR
ncbi:MULTISPECIES: hypothetical protein [Mycolicibacterium]|uniref:hypothetical protein n=1 Tax=Mycolicibacterium TaxID=1866885 RepID=UPI0005689887|nr:MULTISPECIES: hypothetical protein [Mycolicibacterium]MCV7128762.1 hypothetical protein [Mycolicibacterium vanbaalenii PYR-1]QZY44368.1 hypothetical protein K5L12_19045 [Mycolicibacterium austroafricanum]